MARKYTRDNRGRFASRGSGATARGGRLKTAAGNKRKTQTMKAAGASGAGVMKGAVKRDFMAAGKIGKARPLSAVTSKLRPGELMNANAFPANAISKPRRSLSKSDYGIDRRRNLAIAARQARAAGIKVAFVNNGENDVASFQKWGGGGKRGARGQININKDAEAWSNPRAYMRDARKYNMYASANPKAIIAHEIGHAKHSSARNYGVGIAEYGPKSGRNEAKDSKQQRIATKVSMYADTAPVEFVAEVRGARAAGKRYSREIMSSFREAAGLSPKPAARRRSRLK